MKNLTILFFIFLSFANNVFSQKSKRKIQKLLSDKHWLITSKDTLNTYPVTFKLIFKSTGKYQIFTLIDKKEEFLGDGIWQIKNNNEINTTSYIFGKNISEILNIISIDERKLKIKNNHNDNITEYLSER